jgi:3',5'-nucleoside bisphosphate phosphatase
MKFDLHTHSHCSDGALSPAELIARAEAAGVDVLSITDHDIIDAYADLPEKINLELIPGVEFSAQWRNLGLHIVGLDINLDSEMLHQMIERQRQARQERMATICKRLQGMGLQIDVDAFLQQCGDNMLGRPQLASYLVETGQVDSEQKAFRKYLGQGKRGDVHNAWPAMIDVVAAIKSAGGLAVLAHPLKYRQTRTRLKELLTDFRDVGGAAIEVMCGRQIPSDTRYLSELCRQIGLHASVGSDFHSPGVGHTEMGRIGPIAEDLKPVWDLFSS